MLRPNGILLRYHPKMCTTTQSFRAATMPKWISCSGQRKLIFNLRTPCITYIRRQVPESQNPWKSYSNSVWFPRQYIPKSNYMTREGYICVGPVSHRLREPEKMMHQTTKLTSIQVVWIPSWLLRRHQSFLQRVNNLLWRRIDSITRQIVCERQAPDMRVLLRSTHANTLCPLPMALKCLYQVVSPLGQPHSLKSAIIVRGNDPVEGFSAF